MFLTGLNGVGENNLPARRGMIGLKSPPVAPLIGLEEMGLKKKREKEIQPHNSEFEQLMLNPVERHGKRNIYCPYYSLCLDHAVQRGWQYWDCAECPKKTERRPLEESSGAPTQSFEYHGLAHMRTDEL